MIDPENDKKPKEMKSAPATAAPVAGPGGSRPMAPYPLPSEDPAIRRSKKVIAEPKPGSEAYRTVLSCRTKKGTE